MKALSREPSNLGTALLLAFVVAVMIGGQLLDNAQRTDALIAEDALQAQLQAQFEARLDRAARQACHDVAGPHTVAVWTPQGELVCPPMLSMPIAQGGQQ